MGHQPFEDWILDDFSITNEQEDRLQEHLQKCPDCNRLSDSWKKIEIHLDSVEMISPKPGFVNRFQANLITRKSEEFQMQSIKSLLIIGSSVLFIMGLLILWLFLTKTPGEIIVGGVSMFAGITDTFINLRSISFRLIQNLPPYLPPILLIFTLGWGMIISLIWGLTIWRFSRRGVEQK